MADDTRQQIQTPLDRAGAARGAAGDGRVADPVAAHDPFAPGGVRGDAGVLDRGDRGPARLPAGGAALRHAGARRPSAAPHHQAAGQAWRIVDRFGQPLAYSVDADSITADPSDIEDPDKVSRLVCAALDGCNGQQRQQMAERLRSESQFAYLARQITPEEASRVKALDLPGVVSFKESRRYYPNKELAAHLLGYVGVDNVGLAGLESTFDSQSAARRARSSCSVTAGVMPCRRARSTSRPPGPVSS